VIPSSPCKFKEDLDNFQEPKRGKYAVHSSYGSGCPRTSGTLSKLPQTSVTPGTGSAQLLTWLEELPCQARQVCNIGPCSIESWRTADGGQ
jgi:hypothetical protein